MLPEPFYERDQNHACGKISGTALVLVTPNAAPDHSLCRTRGGLMSHSNSCKCGCGSPVADGRAWVSGHNLRRLEWTQAHRDKIGEAQKRAWSTKRARMPIGSTNVTHSGYVVMKVHPGKGRWRPEHVVVMESELGRAIHPPEVVHHVNRVRTDNRPENLYVCRDKSHHMDVERTFDVLLDGLIRDGIIVFDHDKGEYRRS